MTDTPPTTAAPDSAPGSDGDADSIGRDTRTVSGLTLISRFTGLARDLVTARIFGDTAIGSAFAAAFVVPNTFRRLFGEGALSAAFLPEYARLAGEERAAAGSYAAMTIRLVALATGFVTVLLELLLLGVILGLPGSLERSLSLKLMMVALPFMPLVCTAAILGGMLQAHGRFGPWAAAPILLNLAILATAIPYFFLDNTTAEVWAYPITASTLVAGAAQVVWSLRALRGRVEWGRATAEARARTRAMLRRMVPAVIGLGTLQVNSLVDTLLAMWPNWVGPTIAGRTYPLDQTSNSVLFFSQRLYQFPLGVFGIAVATAAFPALSRAAGDAARFTDTLRRGVRLSLFIGLPASVGLVLVGDDLVAALYSGPGGGFSDAGVDRAAAVLFAYGTAVWAYSLNQLITRAFYATGDTRTPMKVAVSMVGLNLVLNFVLIWTLREAGLAASTAICAVLQAILLVVLARRRLGIAGLGGQGLAGSLLLSAGGTVLMALVVLGARSGLGAEDWSDRVLRLAVCVVAGGGVYLVIGVIARRPEHRWLLGRG